MTAGKAPPPAPSGFAATTFFSRTYDEAEALLVEARDYVAASERVRPRRATAGLVHSLETMRLTTRLTQVMAWLLVQKAVHAGELTREEAARAPYLLGGHHVCLDAGHEDAAVLPAPLRDLLGRSRRLYQRVARLDEMVRAGHA